MQQVKDGTHPTDGDAITGGQQSISFCRPSVTLLAMMIASHISIAMAQTTTLVPPGPFQGFSQKCNEPVRIEADTLEVRDKEKTATFFGNVRLVQGKTTLRSKVLIAYFEQSAPAVTAPAPPSGVSADQQRIRRLEAKGDVMVTQEGRSATGETGIVDLVSNTAMLVGNVVITQDRNVVRGDRLSVDLTTGVARVETKERPGGRIRALLHPGDREAGSGAGMERRTTASAPKLQPQQALQPPENSALC